jgi:Caleosin related protein
MHMRLRDSDTGTYYVVDTAARTVCANLEERPRLSRADAVVGALAERALAAATEYEEYFARPVPGTRTPDGRFLVRGSLTRTEAATLAAGRDVPAERTALELHLDFFDADGDGTITLTENYRGWRALGFARFKAALKALFAAVFFGFRIDIEGIAKRRYPSSGVFRPGGGVDELRLAPYLAEFKHVGDELGFAQVLAALERNADPGMVSRAQFRSFFAVCKRMNAGREVVTKAQFVGLFDGSLFWQAASMTDSAGRRARFLRDPVKRAHAAP